MALTPKRDRAVRDPDRQTTAAKDSPWGGLRSRFLASLDPAEQVRIFDLSARTSQTLHRWAARYPLIRRVRVWPLSLSVAAGAPFTSVEALISTARLSLWVFTLDDLFDEERVPQGELMKRAERYRALAHREIPCPTGDSLASALCELRARGIPEEQAYKQAEARVHGDIVAGLEQLTALRNAAVSQTGRPEAAIDNIARFVCDFYTHHDYHTFLAQAA